MYKPYFLLVTIHSTAKNYGFQTSPVPTTLIRSTNLPNPPPHTHYSRSSFTSRARRKLYRNESAAERKQTAAEWHHHYYHYYFKHTHTYTHTIVIKFHSNFLIARASFISTRDSLLLYAPPSDSIQGHTRVHSFAARSRVCMHNAAREHVRGSLPMRTFF